MRIFLTILTAGFLGIACNGDEERYEVVNKLRALGVSSTPTVSAPSTSESPKNVTLTAWAALPKDQSVSADAFIDTKTPFSTPVNVTINPTSAIIEERGPLQIYKISATFIVPSEELLFFSETAGSARVRYGIKLATDGEEEKIVGDYLVFPEGADELSWTNPTLDVTSPTEGGTTDGTVDLEVNIVDNNDEPIRVGWFASDGEIKNRLAAVTEWEPGSGNQTIIATARGRKSGGFSLQVISVGN
jgi:hypothetical protein